MSNRLEGKVALVIGAGCVGAGWGNGNATSVAFAREGADVACVDIELEAARATAKLVEGEGRRALALAADAARAEEVHRAVATTLEHFGRIDVLHYNVGLGVQGGATEVAEEDWDRVFAANAKGAYLACKAVIPQMRKQGRGAIVFVSSVASVGWTGHAILPYAASKAALNQMTRMVAVQHAAEGIRCNCVMPGLIDSPRIYSSVIKVFGGDAEKMRASRSAAVPMKRMGDPWEVARAAVFFASDESSYVTGVVMPVDGGLGCTLSH